MNEHQNICNGFAAYYAGDLDPHQTREFANHLGDCSKCTEDGANLSHQLHLYKNGCQPTLPSGGLDFLQSAVAAKNNKPQQKIMVIRFATAAVLALVFFSSGFWAGRTSSELPLPAALHFPENKISRKKFPQPPIPAFTVAKAESIPEIFSPQNPIPH